MKIPKEIKYFKVQSDNTLLVKLRNKEKYYLKGKVTEEKLRELIENKNQNELL